MVHQGESIDRVALRNRCHVSLSCVLLVCVHTTMCTVCYNMHRAVAECRVILIVIMRCTRWRLPPSTNSNCYTSHGSMAVLATLVTWVFPFSTMVFPLISYSTCYHASFPCITYYSTYHCRYLTLS